MMMPANFSAISENEMTYVVGGAALENILAPALDKSNWQTFNVNMITLIGNSQVQDYVDNTLGVLFSGSYTPGDMIKGWAGRRGYGASAAEVDGDKVQAVALKALNDALQTVTNLAAIYNLATGSVKNALPTTF